jgi:hypothetical protein
LALTICKTNLAVCTIGATLLAARLSRIAPSSNDSTWLDICVHRSRRAITLEAAN